MFRVCFCGRGLCRGNYLWLVVTRFDVARPLLNNLLSLRRCVAVMGPTTSLFPAGVSMGGHLSFGGPGNRGKTLDSRLPPAGWGSGVYLPKPSENKKKKRKTTMQWRNMRKKTTSIFHLARVLWLCLVYLARVWSTHGVAGCGGVQEV